MPRKTIWDVVNYTDMSAAERRALGEEVFQIQRQLFDRDPEGFYQSYFEDKRSKLLELIRFRRADGTTVGFMIIRLLDTEYEGHPFTLMTAGVSILPEYQSENATFFCMYTRYIVHKLKHLHRDLLYVSLMVHPATFHYYQTYARRVYPHWRDGIDDRNARLLHHLADMMGFERTPDAGPFVRKLPQGTPLPDEDTKTRVLTSKAPDMKFFVEQTGLRDAYGMLVLFPVTLDNLLLPVPHLILRQLIKKVRRLMPHPRSSPGIASALSRGRRTYDSA